MDSPLFKNKTKNNILDHCIFLSFAKSFLVYVLLSVSLRTSLIFFGLSQPYYVLLRLYVGFLSFTRDFLGSLLATLAGFFGVTVDFFTNTVGFNRVVYKPSRDFLGLFVGFLG